MEHSKNKQVQRAEQSVAAIVLARTDLSGGLVPAAEADIEGLERLATKAFIETRQPQTNLSLPRHMLRGIYARQQEQAERRDWS